MGYGFKGQSSLFVRADALELRLRVGTQEPVFACQQHSRGQPEGTPTGLPESWQDTEDRMIKIKYTKTVDPLWGLLHLTPLGG